MKTATNLAIGLIAISLSLPIWSALYLIPFVQPERNQIAMGQVHSWFSYENSVHEAGFGRLTISILALFILLIPYRRGERWAFAALAILAVIYYLPVFLLGGVPTLGTWPIIRNFPQPRVTGLSWESWSVAFVTALLFIGLTLSAPGFFRRKARFSATERQAH